MNLKRNTGSYYTPKFIADFMVKWIEKEYPKSFGEILEPSCGDGIFVDSLLEFIHSSKSIKYIDLVEINTNVASNLKNRFIENSKINTHNIDFLNYQKKAKAYSLIIGNPPYIKRSLLTEQQVELSKEVFDFFPTLNKANLKNIWSIFLLKSIHLLKEDGILALVLPAELLQVDYATQLRNLLLNEFSRVEIFTFNELIFSECKGQDTLLLFAYRKTKNPGLYFSNVELLDHLSDFSQIKFTKHSINEKKWSSHSLTSDELKLINSLLAECVSMGDICMSKPGIVTAANNFFILNQSDVKNFNLDNYKKPILQKSSLIQDKITFDNQDYENLNLHNTPCHLIDLNKKEALNDPLTDRYIQYGLSQNLHNRYKMQKRSNWFQVPNNLLPSPLFFFKRCHNQPKLVRNYTKAITTDSAYLVTPKDGYCPNSILFSFYNSFTLVCAEIMGRYYGGGVLELTPNEFRQLPVPYKTISDSDFEEYIKLYNKKFQIKDILNHFNKDILKSYFPTITDLDIESIENIRLKLIKRRHKL